MPWLKFGDVKRIYRNSISRSTDWATSIDDEGSPSDNAKKLIAEINSMNNEMPESSIINFTEITSPTDFELFTCDLLECMGFKIVFRPGEGSDGGRDMAVEEIRQGNFGETKIRYLVSCKHLGKAVGTGDEKDVPSRVHKHHCDAFLGVYSSHPSQTLVDDFNGWQTHPDRSKAFEATILDGSKIRKQLLELPSGQRLVQQYFPKAALAHRRLQTESNIYRKRPIFRCADCGIDILQSFQGSVLVEATHGPVLHPSGNPERDLKNRRHVSGVKIFCPEHTPTLRHYNGEDSSLHSISDLIEPRAFMALLNNGLKQSYYWPPYFNDENAFIRWFRLIQGLFYFVARGREPMAALEGMAALNDQYFNPPWTL